MDNIRSFVLNKIQKKEKISETVDIDSLDYIKEGYVDSIGLIKFVVELETEFDIEITDEEISSNEFRVVGDLIKLIHKKIGEN